MNKDKVLVVDDESLVHHLLERSLGADGYEVLAAWDGRGAARVAEAEQPDLILLDVDLPDKDGLEVLSELRRGARTRVIPVILVTGNGALEDRVSGLSRGADDYVTKPFSLAELKARVGSALRRSRDNLAANPLTRLPGAPEIQREVERRLASGEPFAFGYADIDRFKSFNDRYGYARGDSAIREAAAALTESAQAADEEAFVGHIGGDDFVVVCREERAAELFVAATEAFDRRTPALYDPADRARGGFVGVDRTGARRVFGLMTLTIGAVTTRRRVLDRYARVVALASEMKRQVKSRRRSRRSAFAFDRRSDNA